MDKSPRLLSACVTVGLCAGLMVGLCSEARAQGGLSKEELAAQGIMVVEPEEAGRRHMLEGWVLGLRAGAAIPTEKVLKNVGNGTSVGPAINAEALYAIREWVRAGLMLEWHQHSIDFWGPKFGTLSTVSLLPTVQFRPTAEMMQEYGVTWAVPYASLGTGINFHSFSKDAQTGSASVSFDNTFALRLATGLDFPITSRLAFNTEVAWNRDSGSYTVNGVKADFNASTLNLLVGLRMQF